MIYLGDFAEDQVVYIFLTTFNTGAAPTNPLSPIDGMDFAIYKDDSSTQKLTGNGITMTSPFDNITGLHKLKIDTSVDTGDVGFWQPGHDYTVVLSPSYYGETGTGTTETIGGVSLLASWQFSIENRGNAGYKRSVRAITRGTVNTGASTTSIPTSSLDPSPTVNDQFKGLILSFDKDTTTAALRGQKTDITASTSGGTLTVTALTTAPVSGDTFTIE